MQDPTPGARPVAEFLLLVLQQMVITAEAIAHDPLLRDAMVLVSNNYDRTSIIEQRAQAHAHRLGVLLFKWHLQISLHNRAVATGAD